MRAAAAVCTLDQMFDDIDSEQFWACKLDADKTVYNWDPSDDDSQICKICFSQATLGTEAKAGERNVVEIVVPDVITGRDSSYAILSLSVGQMDSTTLNIAVAGSFKLRLTSGSGPVNIVGTMLMATLTNEESDSDEEMIMSKQHLIHDKENRDTPTITTMDSEDSDEEADENDDNDDDGENKNDSDDDSDNESESDEENDDSDQVDNDSDDEDDDGSDDEEEDINEKQSKKMFSKPNKGVLKAKNKLDTSSNVNIKNKGEVKKSKKVSFSSDVKSDSKGQDFSSVKVALGKIASLPKSQEKFQNFMKSNMKVTDPKIINQAWVWVSKNRSK